MPRDEGYCDCEFDPYTDDPNEESTHYLRKCTNCGHEWYGLHCPHDGYQNACPKCGVFPKPQGWTKKELKVSLNKQRKP